MKNAHIMHYFVLAVILLGGVATFFYVQPNTSLQLIVGVATSIAYVLWGLIHHAMQKDLHQKIVVEYFLIGLIATILLTTILKA